MLRPGESICPSSVLFSFRQTDPSTPGSHESAGGYLGDLPDGSFSARKPLFIYHGLHSQGIIYCGFHPVFPEAGLTDPGLHRVLP